MALLCKGNWRANARLRGCQGRKLKTLTKNPSVCLTAATAETLWIILNYLNACSIDCNRFFISLSNPVADDDHVIIS